MPVGAPCHLPLHAGMLLSLFAVRSAPTGVSVDSSRLISSGVIVAKAGAPSCAAVTSAPARVRSSIALFMGLLSLRWTLSTGLCNAAVLRRDFSFGRTADLQHKLRRRLP